MTHKHLDTEEREWWLSHDADEPLMGVPTVNVVPVPLIATADDEPQPGLAPEQLDGDLVPNARPDL
jgi:hypothetical protein